MFSTIVTYAAPLMRGAALTAGIWIGALVCSLCLGTVLGLVRCAPLRVLGIAQAADLITALLRGVPFYVQLLIAYFVIPNVLGISISALTVATISLGICSAAYVSQLVVSGINAIARAQWEMAETLGYSIAQAVRMIIIPQVLRAILPALCGEADQVLKSTAIVSALGVMELTGVARNIVARDLNPLDAYGAIAVIYLVGSGAMALLAAWLKRRLHYGND